MHAFNADFYVTLATVIPVLYLALTLQGTTFEKVMIYWRSSNKKAPRTFKGQAPTFIVGAVSIAAAGIVSYSVNGEYLALHALYSQDSSSATGTTVYTSVILLLFLTAAGPFARFAATYFGTLADDHRRFKAERQRLNQKSESAPVDEGDAKPPPVDGA